MDTHDQTYPIELWWACLSSKLDEVCLVMWCEWHYDTPAHMAIDEYIAPTATDGWQGRPRTTLPTTLDNDLQGVGETAPQQARLAT